MSVNLDLSPLDKLLGLAAGTVSAFRKVFLKSDGVVFYIVLTLLFSIYVERIDLKLSFKLYLLMQFI